MQIVLRILQYNKDKVYIYKIKMEKTLIEYITRGEENVSFERRGIMGIGVSFVQRMRKIF